MSALHELLDCEPENEKPRQAGKVIPLRPRPSAPIAFDPLGYDRYAVAISGGKDSVAILLHLFDLGVDPKKIELHHHLVDGRESNLMDWPVSEDYVRKLAHAFGLKIYFSWRVGGIEREMLRNGTRTAPVAFESEDGTVKVLGGDRGKSGVRLKFPQTTSNLTQRYCSAYAKIDVFARVLVNETRFRSGRTLVVTGERAEESAARALYATLEPHRSDNRNGEKVQRYIDHWRPVHGWSEAQVWEIIRRFKINPHPAYWLGWGRMSCRNCIFNSANMWATVRTHMPHAFTPIANYERQFNVTIHRTKTVEELAASGTPFPCSIEMLELAESTEYYAPIFVDDWQLPPGAFKEGAGPS